MWTKNRFRPAYDYVQLLAGAALWGVLLAAGPKGTYALSAGGRFVFPDVGLLSPWALLAALLLVSCAATFYKFALGSSGYFVSFDISFAVATIFLVSPFAGAVIAVLSASADLAHRLIKRRDESAVLLQKFAGTAGNRLLRFGLAWLAFVLVGGSSGTIGGRAAVVPLLAAFVVYFLSNNIFFLPDEWLKEADLRIYWREAFTLDLAYSFVICTLGYLLTLVAFSMGLVPFTLFAAFILMATYLFSTLTSTESELKIRVEDLTILSRASAAAASDLDVMPMVVSFTRALAESLPADGIGVIFYQRYATTIYLVQVEGEKNRSTYLPEERRFQYDQLPLSDPSRRLGERLYEFLQPLETAPFKIPPTVFGLPLVHGGEPFGGIVVYSYQENVPLDEKRELLELCAQSLVVGLENCFLHLQAIQDPVSGLYNRSYFLYRLEEELSFSVRHRAPFALLMIDLDDFKAVNDHLGHAMGDEVIHRIGDLLRTESRGEDVPARYGGDEFIVLLLGCPQDAAVEKAERIRASIAGKALPKEEAEGLTIGCSIGLLHSDAIRGDQDIPRLLRRLDEALYSAKQTGKNRVVVAK